MSTASQQLYRTRGGRSVSKLDTEPISVSTSTPAAPLWFFTAWATPEASGVDAHRVVLVRSTVNRVYWHGQRQANEVATELLIHDPSSAGDGLVPTSFLRNDDEPWITELAVDPSPAEVAAIRARLERKARETFQEAKAKTEALAAV